MATATCKFSVSPIVTLGDITQELVTYYGTITFSAAADTYASGGLLAGTGFTLAGLGPYADRTPLDQNIVGSGSLEYRWISSSTKLQIFAGGGSGTTGLTEITNGTALNAVTPNVFTDTVTFRMAFPRK